ncbi:helix-turn-helix domain-containing protein [Microvirga pudoricolor]|uniref:helix-turn-helix domain-containing protein n=1 Tax=Microvirga pudoricolor TaxID=2778729 RepID=UPI00194E6AFB|nr:cupin domain-containing protein [Microvirga pudoricolor]MBM6593625.1 helix-turn-helix domain-containing protein [Microvirga pudoricolor]
MTTYRLTLGRRLKQLRKENGWTLAETAERTGLAISTISKVERGQMSLTYDRFVPLAQSLGLDVGALFTGESRSFGPDALMVTRRGDAERYDSPTYVYEMLAAGLSNKQMTPMLGRVTARSFAEFEGYIRHAGEEFLIVTKGALRVHMDGRSPVDLDQGDSLYFNSGVGHAYTSTSPEEAEILVVCWQDRNKP